MTVYLFDNTLEGLLTAVFDAFERREQPDELLTQGEALPLFAERVHEVIADTQKARRVWTGLEKRLPADVMRMITVGWLSEMRELNTPLFRYICKVFRADNARSVVENFADEDVLRVTQIARKVAWEQHRMLQFVRFQKAKDGTYLGVISPDHNVLPLITDHFRDRFGDQPWLLYDAKRRYGYYYDLRELTRVSFVDTEMFNLQNGKMNSDILQEDDALFQELWRTYIKAVCIEERKNPRKQANDMPRRYWRYLTEKQGGK